LQGLTILNGPSPCGRFKGQRVNSFIGKPLFSTALPAQKTSRLSAYREQPTSTVAYPGRFWNNSVNQNGLKGSAFRAFHVFEDAYWNNGLVSMAAVDALRFA
jgi:hypothetical protein